MKRLLIMVAAGLWLVGCTTTNARLADATPDKPAAGARILVLQPDIQLNILTAAGLQEPRADWSAAAKQNLSKEVEAALSTKSHNFKMLDANSAMAGRSGQLLRLHGAVGQSILAFNYGAYALPTKKKGTFEWTVGSGAQTLGTTYDADYALFITGRGSYASGGRVATMVGLAMLGVSVPLGSQTVFCSLVELKTGRVVWFNVANAGTSADIREAAGATNIVAALFKTLPL
jgi:hypothetical protein